MQTASREIPPELIGNLRNWAQRRQVRFLVIFGSRASGKSREDSDLDIAVWPGPHFSPMDKLAWIGELEQVSKLPIDLVIVERNTSPLLGMEIVRNCRVVFEAQPNQWQSEKLRLWHIYLDTAPLRELGKKVLKNISKKYARV